MTNRTKVITISVIIISAIIFLLLYFNFLPGSHSEAYCDKFSGQVNYAWGNGSFDETLCENAGCRLEKNEITCGPGDIDCGGIYYKCLPK